MQRVTDRIRGFTLVELAIVITVIAILFAISVVIVAHYQGDTRDAARTANINVIAEALEKYYDVNGEYPGCTAISAPAADVTAGTLVGIDTTALRVPQAPSTQSNSIKCTSAGDVLSIHSVDFFEYQGDGSAACNGSGPCQNFTLKYKDETNGVIRTLPSRRSTSVATYGHTTTLAARNTSLS